MPTSPLPIWLKVTDIYGGSTIASTNLTITPVAPTNVSAGGPYTINEGIAVQLTASAVDPSENTGQLQYVWTIDGTSLPVTSANPTTVTWMQLSGLGINVNQPSVSYPVTVTVTDNNGNSPSTTSNPVTLTVDGLPPTNVSAGGPYAINEGSPLVLSASATDPLGNAGDLTYAWTVNGTSGAAAGADPTLTWSN